MSSRVSAILLAAGSSRRMGQPKQLLLLNGKSFIEHCIDNIQAAGIEDIVVVLGRDSGSISGLLQELPVKIAINPDPDSDMAASVRAGLDSIENSSSGTLICLCDHPLVTASTIKALLSRHDEANDSIIIPAFNNIRGHPALFPRALVSEVYSGRNLREIKNENSEKVELLNVTDEGVIIDIDTKEDYARAQKMIRS